MWCHKPTTVKRATCQRLSSCLLVRPINVFVLVGGRVHWIVKNKNISPRENSWYRYLLGGTSIWFPHVENSCEINPSDVISWSAALHNIFSKINVPWFVKYARKCILYGFPPVVSVPVVENHIKCISFSNQHIALLVPLSQSYPQNLSVNFVNKLLPSGSKICFLFTRHSSKNTVWFDYRWYDLTLTAVNLWYAWINLRLSQTWAYCS